MGELKKEGGGGGWGERRRTKGEKKGVGEGGEKEWRGGVRRLGRGRGVEETRR